MLKTADIDAVDGPSTSIAMCEVCEDANEGADGRFWHLADSAPCRYMSPLSGVKLPVSRAVPISACDHYRTTSTNMLSRPACLVIRNRMAAF
jgi:hypothetical protein